mgnify:CR=1 FL=1
MGKRICVRIVVGRALVIAKTKLNRTVIAVRLSVDALCYFLIEICDSVFCQEERIKWSAA